MTNVFTASDILQIRARGIPLDEIHRQLRHFVHPPAPARLVRPCVRGDGIETIDAADEERCLARWSEAAAAGRFTRFVPASGAASRMFQALLAMADDPDLDDPSALEARAAGGGAGPRDVLRLLMSMDRLPFCGALEELLRRRGVELAPLLRERRAQAILDAILPPAGLGLPLVPKGLLPFHRDADGVRTPFDEHLAEGAETVADAAGVCRLHFTVSPEAVPLFTAHAERARGGIEARRGVRFALAYSTQDPATDTLAVDAENRPFREADGTLTFRPGGHGALLVNLASLGGDLVFIKNIDNVVPESRRATTVRWKRILAGRLVELHARVGTVLGALDAGRVDATTLEEGRRLLETLGAAEASTGGGPDAAEETLPELLRTRLDRPLRVCGVVRNEGEPGGGPFWVRDGEGRISRQIVEGSQMDAADPAQRTVWKSSTHFNPVDLVCALRDRRGRPYDLARYVDEETVFIARKSKDGRELKALERPGLWNGAMAFWNTVFVEVPIGTFAPVKTVFDLLRPEHQPAS